MMLIALVAISIHLLQLSKAAPGLASVSRQ
jgi:hypothetical protein